MREIRFRCWDTKNERMVYDPYHFDIYHCSDENRVNQKTYQFYEDWRDLEDGRGIECELMQYTGLRDRNGKEIYEADIILVEVNKKTIVSWSNRFASFCLKNDTWMFQHWFGEAVDGSDCEVIGN